MTPNVAQLKAGINSCIGNMRRMASTTDGMVLVLRLKPMAQTARLQVQDQLILAGHERRP